VELQRNYKSFQGAGAEVIAVAVAPAASVNGARQATRAAYPMLADSTHQVAEAYGVYNLLGDRLATPSVFIIDTSGRVVWSYVGRSPGDRPRAQAILEQLP